MSEERSGGHVESGSMGSSRDSIWRERRQKRREDRERKQREEESGLGEGLDQTHRTISGASGHGQFDEKDLELERLCRLVRDLELEARDKRYRRDRGDRERGDDSKGNRGKEGSSRSDSCQRWDRSLSRGSHRSRNRSHSRESRQCWAISHSHGYVDHGSDSPEERQPYNIGMDTMSQALRRVAR